MQDQKNPLQGFLGDAPQPAAALPEVSRGPISDAIRTEAQEKIGPDEIKKISYDIQRRYGELLDKFKKSPGTRECAVEAAAIYKSIAEMTGLDAAMQRKVADEMQKYGSAEGGIRAREWLEGAMSALSWALGLMPSDPIDQFMANVKSDPDWTCPRPNCKDCTKVREEALTAPKGAYFLPPIGRPL